MCYKCAAKRPMHMARFGPMQWSLRPMAHTAYTARIAGLLGLWAGVYCFGFEDVIALKTMYWARACGPLAQYEVYF